MVILSHGLRWDFMGIYFPLVISHIAIENGDLVEHDDFPIKHGDFPIENGDFPIEHGDFPIEHGDFPIKHGDFPIENGDCH
jgi:hypothetical protein